MYEGKNQAYLIGFLPPWSEIASAAMYVASAIVPPSKQLTAVDVFLDRTKHARIPNSHEVLSNKFQFSFLNLAIIAKFIPTTAARGRLTCRGKYYTTEATGCSCSCGQKALSDSTIVRRYIHTYLRRKICTNLSCNIIARKRSYLPYYSGRVHGVRT